jgi:hypothetical protein
MKKEFKKQVIIGIAGVLGTALIAWGAYAVWGWGASESRWLRYAVLAVLTACFFGSLLYIFGGIRSFISGAGSGFVFVALSVSAIELSSWVFGILIVAAVLVFVARPLIRQYRKDREENSTAVIDPKLAEEIRQEEAEEAELREADSEFKKSIRFGEKSLLLFTQTGGMYQLIRGIDKLYFIRIGGELSGMDEELIRTDFLDETRLIQGKKDFDIAQNEIAQIRCRYGSITGVPMESCAEIKIKTDRRTYTFAVLDHLPERRLATFFGGLPFSAGVKKQARASARGLTEEEKRILPGLKKACLALTVLAIVAGAAFIFLPGGPVLYRVLSAACILIPVAAFVLYMKYNNLLSIEDSNDSMFKRSRANISTALLIPSGALVMRTIYDFNVTGWASFAIWSGAMIAVVLLMMFKFTKEYKRKKSVIWMIVLVALFYAPSAVVQVNGLYDYSEPVVYSTTLLDKHISEGRSSTRYIYTVEMEDGSEKDLGVSREFYREQVAGDTVTVVEQSGLLGIDYAYIPEE